MRALQPLDGHRAGHRSDPQHLLRFEKRKGADGLHGLGAVHQGEALLRLEHHRLEPRAPQRFAPGQPLAAEERLALADQHQGEVRQGSEIAARAHRALLGHDGDDVPLEQRDQEVQRALADSAVPSGEHVRAKQHQRAHCLRRQGDAHSGGVRMQQVALQLAEIGARDGHLGQRAEPGVHAVGGDAALGDAVHQPARGPHALARRRGDLDVGATGRGLRDLLELQRVAVDDDAHRASSTIVGRRPTPPAAASRRQPPPDRAALCFGDPGGAVFFARARDVL